MKNAYLTLLLVPLISLAEPEINVSLVKQLPPQSFTASLAQIYLLASNGQIYSENQTSVVAPYFPVDLFGYNNASSGWQLLDIAAASNDYYGAIELFGLGLDNRIYNRFQSGPGALGVWTLKTPWQLKAIDAKTVNGASALAAIALDNFGYYYDETVTTPVWRKVSSVPAKQIVVGYDASQSCAYSGGSYGSSSNNPYAGCDFNNVLGFPGILASLFPQQIIQAPLYQTGQNSLGQQNSYSSPASILFFSLGTNNYVYLNGSTTPYGNISARKIRVSNAPDGSPILYALTMNNQIFSYEKQTNGSYVWIKNSDWTVYDFDVMLTPLGNRVLFVIAADNKLYQQVAPYQNSFHVVTDWQGLRPVVVQTPVFLNDQQQTTAGY